MKICLISEYFPSETFPISGGVEARTFALAKELLNKNDVYVITSLLENLPKEEEYFGISIFRVGKKRKYSRKGAFAGRLSFIRLARNKCIELKPDIIDGSGFVSWPAAFLGSKNNSSKSVATVHEIWKTSWWRNVGYINGIPGYFLERRFLKFDWDKYIAISQFTAEKLNDLINNWNKISIIPNGIDLNEIDSVITEKKFSRPTIVTIGRLTKEKRINDLIKALNYLLMDDREIHLKIIGTGPEYGKLVKLAKSLNCENNVSFLGKVKEKRQLIKILKQSQVFAFPTIMEGFGIVLIEAMASKIPYVASDIPPIREITNGGEGGFLFRPKDVKNLYEKLSIAINEKELALKGRKIVEQKYQWKTIALDLEKIYFNLLE